MYMFMGYMRFLSIREWKKNERRVSYLKVSLYIGQRKSYIITFTQPIIEVYRLFIIIFYLSID